MSLLLRCLFALALGYTIAYALLPLQRALGHDHARPGLDKWYQGQHSGKGPCCDGPEKDAITLTDVDWESRDGHYRVRLEGEWYDVPEEAVLPGPNLDGRTIVWPIHNWEVNGAHKYIIRCFIPGSMV